MYSHRKINLIFVMGVISLLANNMIAVAKPWSPDVEKNKEMTNMADNAFDPNADESNMLNSEFEPISQDQLIDLYVVSSPNKTDDHSIAKIEIASTHLRTNNENLDLKSQENEVNKVLNTTNMDRVVSSNFIDLNITEQGPINLEASYNESSTTVPREQVVTESNIAHMSFSGNESLDQTNTEIVINKVLNTSNIDGVVSSNFIDLNITEQGNTKLEGSLNESSTTVPREQVVMESNIAQMSLSGNESLDQTNMEIVINKVLNTTNMDGVVSSNFIDLNITEQGNTKLEGSLNESSTTVPREQVVMESNMAHMSISDNNNSNITTIDPKAKESKVDDVVGTDPVYNKSESISDDGKQMILRLNQSKEFDNTSLSFIHLDKYDTTITPDQLNSEGSGDSVNTTVTSAISPPS